MPSRTLTILSANLKALMESHPTLTSQRKIAQAAGVDQKTVNRTVTMATEPTLEVVEAIAAAFHLMPWQLLVPELNVKNPPVLLAVSEAERELYRNLKKSVEAYTGQLQDAGNTRPGGLEY